MSKNTAVMAHNPNINYNPIILHVDSNGNIIENQHDQDVAGTLKCEHLWAIDALHHYFTHEDTDDVYASEQDDVISPAQLLARLITRKYDPQITIDRKLDPVTQFIEPSWTTFRDQTSFITGDVIPYTVESVIGWVRYLHGDNMIVLDGTDYYKDYATSTDIELGVSIDKGNFSDLMHVANNTKQIIDEGIVDLYPNDSRRVMKFINGAPTDYVLEGNTGGHTKWFMEGRFLAKRLVEYPVFRKNYNLIVITNAMRWVMANDVNLNNLYRLLAKLGRINTRVVFLG